MAEDLNSGCQEQIQLAVRAGLELGASELQVQRSNHTATLPTLLDVTCCVCLHTLLHVVAQSLKRVKRLTKP